jgi:hypothetical protein
MSAEHQTDTQAADDLSDQASRHTLALNPLVGLRGKDLYDSAGILVKAMLNEPRVAIAQWLSFLGELNDIVCGKSERAPQPGDKRFSDPTWTNSTHFAARETLPGRIDWYPAATGVGRIDGVGKETGPVTMPNYGAFRFTRVGGPIPGGQS